jgi:hypothetical protein
VISSRGSRQFTKKLPGLRYMGDNPRHGVSGVFARVSVLFCIVLESVACVGQLIGIGSAETCTPVATDTLSLCAGTLVPVMLTEKMNSRAGSLTSSKAIVVSNIMVGNHIVIARGTAVEFSAEAVPARWKSQSGSLIIDLHGAHTVTGQMVDLVGSTPWVYGPANGCMDWASYLCKGLQATARRGTLIAGWVHTTIHLDRRALEEPEQSSREPLETRPHVFLYSGEVEATWGKSVDVRIDGKAAGHIGSHQYACLSIDVGKHIIRTGHTETEIEALHGAEYFVRVEKESWSKPVTLRRTEGFDYGPETLTPAHIQESVGNNACVG